MNHVLNDVSFRPQHEEKVGIGACTLNACHIDLLLDPCHSKRTVLSGPEERGVDGPSLDRSSFFATPANVVLIFQSVFYSQIYTMKSEPICRLKKSFFQPGVVLIFR